MVGLSNLQKSVPKRGIRSDGLPLFTIAVQNLDRNGKQRRTEIVRRCLPVRRWRNLVTDLYTIWFFAETARRRRENFWGFGDVILIFLMF